MTCDRQLTAFGPEAVLCTSHPLGGKSSCKNRDAVLSRNPPPRVSWLLKDTQGHQPLTVRVQLNFTRSLTDHTVQQKAPLSTKMAQWPERGGYDRGSCSLLGLQTWEQDSEGTWLMSPKSF